MAKLSLCRHHPRWEPYALIGLVRIWCSEASCHSCGCKSRQHRSPVDAVVISSDGKGDRPVESLEVKGAVGWENRSDPYRASSNLTGRSKVRTTEAPKYRPRVKRICGNFGSAETLYSRRRPMSTPLLWNLSVPNSPGS